MTLTNPLGQGALSPRLPQKSVVLFQSVAGQHGVCVCVCIYIYTECVGVCMCVMGSVPCHVLICEGLTSACIRLCDDIKPLNARENFTSTYNGHTGAGDVHAHIFRRRVYSVFVGHLHHMSTMSNCLIGMRTGRCYLCFASYV